MGLTEIQLTKNTQMMMYAVHVKLIQCSVFLVSGEHFV